MPELSTIPRLHGYSANTGGRARHCSTQAPASRRPLCPSQSRGLWRNKTQGSGTPTRGQQTLQGGERGPGSLGRGKGRWPGARTPAHRQSLGVAALVHQLVAVLDQGLQLGLVAGHPEEPGQLLHHCHQVLKDKKENRRARHSWRLYWLMTLAWTPQGAVCTMPYSDLEASLTLALSGNKTQRVGECPRALSIQVADLELKPRSSGEARSRLSS